MQYHGNVISFRAVIDTNVLHAGLYSAAGASYQILHLIEQGAITPLLSTALLFEYEEVLKRHQKLLGLSDRAVDDVLDGLCARGECRRIHFLWRPQLADPKDDHILELAVAAGGTSIVTHNVHDFAAAAAFGVRVITPGTLLGALK
jgi:putative PIN family toxin of toxin-antitoxin system